MLPAESENDALTYERTDGHSNAIFWMEGVALFKVAAYKIDKPLVVYRFSGKRYDVHNSVAYIMTNQSLFTPEMRFQINLYIIYDK